MVILIKDALQLDNPIHLSETNYFKKIYGVEISKTMETYKVLEHTILNWNGKVKIHCIDGNIIWEPLPEHLLHIDIINKYSPKIYQYGYIDGKRSHLGPLNKSSKISLNYGYIFWQNFK